ncbi:hypothetical protein D3C76_1316320 [compost metagenome]
MYVSSTFSARENEDVQITLISIDEEEQVVSVRLEKAVADRGSAIYAEQVITLPVRLWTELSRKVQEGMNDNGSET